MAIRETDLRNPMEIYRPFGARVTLVPGGQCLLVDDIMILAVGFGNPRNRRPHLRIATQRSVNIITEKALRGNRVDMLEKPEVNSSIEGKFITAARRIGLGMSAIYVGDQYKITYIDNSRRGLNFRIESTHPMQAIPLSREVDYRGTLERVQKDDKPHTP